MKKFKLLSLIVLSLFLISLVGCDINLDFGGNQGTNQGSSQGGENQGNSQGGENQGNSGGDDEPIHLHHTVNFFTLNDVHGHLITDVDVEIYAGLDKTSTILHSLEENDDYIKISNGDMFQGTQFSNSLYGLPGIEWMNLENFDCFVIGNHEFDWGIDKIAAYKDGNLDNGELAEDCEILGCNIYLKSTNAMPSWLQAYSIEECNGYKVGVIGCIGEGLTSSISASMVADYKFVDPVPLVREYAKKLRIEEKCNVVIVSIHEYDQNTNNRFAALADESRIDAIICGHSHTENADHLTRSDGYIIPVIQCRGYNSSNGTINISMNDNKPVSNGSINHYYPSRYESNKAAYDLLYKRYKDIKETNSVVAYSTRNFSKENLGKLCCDALRDKYEVEVGICNVGGIRSTIASGDITYSDIYNVFPFDNTVFIIKMNGRDLENAINSSLYYTVDESMLNSGDLFKANQVYNVAIISYVYENYNAFNTKALEANDTSILVRDVVAEYMAIKYPKN